MEQLKNYHSNREIKFRLWDFEEKKMIYPSLSHNEKYVLQLNCEYMGKFNGKTYDTIKIPKMAFTGLRDRLNQEIYEGDICSGHSDGIGIITWTDFDGGYDYVFADEANVGIYEVRKNIQVIGNVYQNPELFQ